MTVEVEEETNYCEMCTQPSEEQPKVICQSCLDQQKEYMATLEKKAYFESDEFKAKLDKIQEEFDIHFYRSPNTDILTVITQIIETLTERGSRYQNGFEKLVEETLVYMRVNQLLVQSIAQGGTHRDKAYRCDYAIEIMGRQYRHLQGAKNLEFFEKLAWEKDYNGPSYESLETEKKLRELERNYSQLAKKAIQYRKLVSEKDYDFSREIDLGMGEHWTIDPNPRKDNY